MRMDSVSVAATPATAQAPPPALGSIASRWRELQGEGSWAGLLDPIDIDLRASVIAYGELAAAAYDGFNTETRSKHVGMCLYNRDELLTACGVSSPGHYKVTKFLYAPCGWVRPMSMATKAFFVRPLREGNGWTEVNWMGYVAVATDEGVAALGRRDIVVVWRGTVERLEYFTDIFLLCQASAHKVLGSSTVAAHKDAKVHRGFLAVYTSKDEQFPHNQTNVKGQVFEEVKSLMKLYKDEVTSITVTGHSLGAALATLNAVDMVANGINVPPASSKQPPCPVTAILFASPRVGNGGFKAAFASFPDLRALSVRNDFDLVPSIPPSLPLIWYENNVGTAVMRINTSQSQHLRKSFGNSLRFWKHHNLEVYLHGIAGYHGAGKEFRLVVNRDVVLLNKWADLLKDESLAPANWWIVQNKCMARDPADGHWKLMDFKEDGSLLVSNTTM